jgi:hypothetical protein
MQAARSSLTALLAACALLGAAGCANTPASTDATITYETTPEGAVIFEGGQSLGAAPVTRVYKHDGKSPTIRTPEVTAVWSSGAKEAYYTLVPPGADRVATIERPKGAPGLQADLDHAKQLVATRSRDAQRNKEATARDIARASARCKEQMAKGGTPAISDC